jgi:hypothetical protein
LKTSPETCPNCGAELPKNARACPECGSDEETGWSGQASVSALDLPDDNFNYDEFVKNEFGGHRDYKPRGLHWFWWVVAVVLLTAILYWIFAKVFSPLH